MQPDPFRIQLLTITLDSQVVLTIVGVAASGVVFSLAARRMGAAVGAGTWWDLVTAAVVGARVVWVVTHLDYYLRGPLQVVVILDGGLSPVGLVLGMAYGLWRLRGHRPGGPAWRVLVELAALATVVAFLVERAGCALTTCGGGPLTDAVWALRRGDELRQPLALAQVAILATALLWATAGRRPKGSIFSVAWAALAAAEVLALWAGRGGEPLIALGMAMALYGAAASLEGRRGRMAVPVPRA